MKMMRYIVLFAGVYLFVIFCTTGCEGRESYQIPQSLDNTEQTEEASKETIEDLKETIEKATDITSEVDVDLTIMSSTMVYAEVNQMMVSPEDYIGKTVKMRGLYYASYYEANEKYYHCVIISDATACCSQGIEFIWGDGSHIYPDEYPSDETLVEVTGIFETYQEDGDTNLYCRLKNAEMKIL